MSLINQNIFAFEEVLENRPFLRFVKNHMTASEEISLRPLSLRPGGGNPFAGFAMGAGLGLKNKASEMHYVETSDAFLVHHHRSCILTRPSLLQVVAGAVSDEKKKPREEVIKYSPEFLMKFAEVGL